jgi:hypothetical protein
MSPRTEKKNDLAIKILMFDVSKENIFDFIRLFAFTSEAHLAYMKLQGEREHFHLNLITLGISIVIPLEHFWHQTFRLKNTAERCQRRMKMKLFNVSHTSRLFNFR